MEDQSVTWQSCEPISTTRLCQKNNKSTGPLCAVHEESTLPTKERVTRDFGSAPQALLLRLAECSVIQPPSYT